MSTFDEIETRITFERGGVLRKFSERIRLLESYRPWLVGLGVCGAFVAALSRLDPTGTAGLLMAVSGGIVAALSGLAVAVFDFKKLELGTDLLTAEETAAAAISAGRAIEAELQNVIEGATILDARRRERFTANAEMLQAAEAGLIGNKSAAATADALLKRSIASIRKATDYRAAEFFTVSIFKRVASADGERMVRVAAQWTNPHLAELGGRGWALGHGYTGVAWQKAQTNPNGDVIEANTDAPEIYRQYPVDDRDPAREALYRSIASIPILTGPQNDVWGVVTATSDRPGMFTRDKSQIQVQNVEMIRDIARIAGLLAGLP